MERIIDFRSKLSSTLSRNFVDDIVESVHQHPQDFISLYDLIRDEEIKVSWRAVWTCEKLCKIHPEWFIPKYEELTKLLLNCKHDGTKRLFLAILYKLPVPKDCPVELYDFCINRMLSKDEAIAVQALCVKLAYNICSVEPDLFCELKIYLENAETDYYSPAVKSTIKNFLKRINKKNV